MRILFQSGSALVGSQTFSTPAPTLVARTFSTPTGKCGSPLVLGVPSPWTSPSLAALRSGRVWGSFVGASATSSGSPGCRHLAAVRARQAQLRLPGRPRRRPRPLPAGCETEWGWTHTVGLIIIIIVIIDMFTSYQGSGRRPPRAEAGVRPLHDLRRLHDVWRRAQPRFARLGVSAAPLAAFDPRAEHGNEADR